MKILDNKPQLSKIKVSRKLNINMTSVEVLQSLFIYKDERNEGKYIVWMVQKNQPDFYLRMSVNEIFKNVQTFTLIQLTLLARTLELSKFPYFDYFWNDYLNSE